MRKQLAGTALLTAAVLFMVNLPEAKQNNPGVNQQHKKGDRQTEVELLPEGQVPVTFVKTIDGDTIKVRVMGKIEMSAICKSTHRNRKSRACVSSPMPRKRLNGIMS